MPSKSKSQQRFFGAVVSCKETGECASAKIKKTADGISMKDAKAFARSTIKKKKRKKHMHESSNFVSFSVWLESKEDGCQCDCKGCTKDGKNCDKCVCKCCSECKKCTCKGCKCKNKCKC